MSPKPFAPSRGVRVGSLLCAASTTAVIVGSQLGIARNHIEQTDAHLAAARLQTVAQKATSPAPAAPRS
jgi:hypothetical protein